MILATTVTYDLDYPQLFTRVQMKVYRNNIFILSMLLSRCFSSHFLTICELCKLISVG